MINFYNQVPTIYSNASRDFQYLEWLINIVLNSVKHNVDDLYNLPNATINPKLTELLATTLGFKVKRNYEQKQLVALASIFPTLLRYKGTATAVEMLGKALVATSGSEGDFTYSIKQNQLEVVLPKELVDTTLFMDVLPYILPAGLTCKIVRRTQKEFEYKTDLQYSNNMRAKWYKDYDGNKDPADNKDLASLFSPTSEQMTLENTNFREPENELDEAALNAGLLSNTIIPILEPLNITQQEEGE